MTVVVREEYLIKCPDLPVRHEPSECQPYIWLKESIIPNYNLYNIDGYTVDFRKKAVTALFMKREYNYDHLEDITGSNLIDALFRKEGKEDWIYRLKLSKKMNVPFFLVFWPFDYPYVKHESLNKPVFILNTKIDDLNKINFLLKRENFDSLGLFIKKYRNNFSFSNVKPLWTARTYMECALSKTPNPWPGDLDGVITTNNGEVKALLEFKTHNLDTPIEEEEVNKYMSEDLRRFNVLMYLQEEIGKVQRYKPNILFVVWGNKEKHKKIKIQVINDHNIIKEMFIYSPVINGDYNNFCKQIMSIM